MVQPWACQRVHDPSPCRLYRCTLPIIILWFRLDAAGCPMLLIFLPSFIISLCSPGLKLLPETQSALPLCACLEGRVLVGQHAVPKELLYLPPPVNGLRLELRDTLNYCGMPHAAPGDRDLIAVFVYLQQVHARRLFFFTVAQKWTSWKGWTSWMLRQKSIIK